MILVTAVTFLLMAGPSSQPLPRLISTPAQAANRESISVRWKVKVNEPVCLAMSHGGRFLSTVDKDGSVRFFNQHGDRLWEQQVEGATDVLIAKSGQSVLVYSKLNPVHTTVHFFRGDGRRLWAHDVKGSVWSGDVSSDGAYAAVSTGQKYLYVYSPDPNRPKFRRWRLEGIGHNLTFVPGTERLVIGTWQDSGLVCFKRNGNFLWRYILDAERQYRLQASADGKTILGMLPGKQREPGMELCLWDIGGKLLWKRTIDGFDGRALVSPGSQYVATSYANVLTDSRSNVIERKVAVFKSDGQLLWEKGGLFFGPRLVALSPGGSSVIVWDGEKSLYNIDKRGKILSKLALSGMIQNTLSSEDGYSILVYCSDGWLYLLKIG